MVLSTAHEPPHGSTWSAQKHHHGSQSQLQNVRNTLLLRSIFHHLLLRLLHVPVRLNHIPWPLPRLTLRKRIRLRCWTLHQGTNRRRYGSIQAWQIHVGHDLCGVHGYALRKHPQRCLNRQLRLFESRTLRYVEGQNRKMLHLRNRSLGFVKKEWRPQNPLYSTVPQTMELRVLPLLSRKTDKKNRTRSHHYRQISRRRRELDTSRHHRRKQPRRPTQWTWKTHQRTKTISRNTPHQRMIT